MNKILSSLYGRLRDLLRRETGQDMVEYALVVALIAFGATAGMGKVASAIKTAFSNVSTQLGNDVT